jgi:putative methylase
VVSTEIPLRKRDLEIALQSVVPHPNPKVLLEQYTIPSDLAAHILFYACYTYGDIRGKSVIDLGTGSGRLALGAVMLGAKSVVGVDIDPESLQSALANSRRLGLEVDWVISDITSLQGRFDTVLMNPPFGTKNRHNDVRFLRVALDLGKIIYSIHKSTTMSFISRWLKEKNARSESIIKTEMPIGHQFVFHRKKRYFVEVEAIRIRRTS